MKYNDLSKEQLLDIISQMEQTLVDKKYGLVWDNESIPEKVVENCKKYLPTLKRINDLDINNEGINNILIEGDNYHVLSSLSYTHKEAIDVIYIDPPYNTGNEDFKYNDKFVDKEDGYRHSKWLNFMYKRLQLSRDLLSNEGVIFISIDDNEFAQLKLMCDKIFGEQNLLEIFHIQVRYDNKSLNEKDDFQKLIEYVLIYAKNKREFKPNKPHKPYDISKFTFEITELSQGEVVNLGGKRVEIFKPDQWKIKKKEPRIGLLKETWASGSVLKGNTSGKFFNDYIADRKEIDGLGILYKVDGIGADDIGYRYFTGPKRANATKGKFYSGVPTDRLEEINNGGSKKYSPIINFYDYSADFGNIRHEGGVGFRSGKKPIKLLKQLINISPNKNAVVLDFFAGSGSTGHAVLDLNNDDGGKRRFILNTSNEGDICREVCYKRLSNVISGYQSERGQTVYQGLGENLIYLQTDFVKNSKNRDQVYVNFISECSTIICLKEDTFISVVKNDYYEIYSNNDGKYTCIYFDPFYDQVDEFINSVKGLNGYKYLYFFSFEDSISLDLSGINGEVKAVPKKILDMYRTIFSRGI